MPSVIILSGVSGSGKTTYANKFIGDGVNSSVVSADDYFTNSLGEYRFDPTKLGAAHAECFRSFIAALQQGRSLIIVDNTNTTAVEIAPYMLAAAAFGYNAEIFMFTCNNGDDIKKCSSRNVHNVPFFAVKAQGDRLLFASFPPYWNVVKLPVQF